MQVNAHSFVDDGTFPNNPRLPLLHYVNAVPKNPEAIEELFHRNKWSEQMWRDIVYPFQHYHSTAHEVLGCYRGWCIVKFGGEGAGAKEVRFEAGDVVVIPAGVAHMALEKSDDFICVGSYPAGQIVDLMRGVPGERPAADERIRHLGLPLADPVQGEKGALVTLWSSAKSI